VGRWFTDQRAVGALAEILRGVSPGEAHQCPADGDDVAALGPRCRREFLERTLAASPAPARSRRHWSSTTSAAALPSRRSSRRAELVVVRHRHRLRQDAGAADAGAELRMVHSFPVAVGDNLLDSRTTAPNRRHWRSVASTTRPRARSLFNLFHSFFGENSRQRPRPDTTARHGLADGSCRRRDLSRRCDDRRDQPPTLRRGLRAVPDRLAPPSLPEIVNGALRRRRGHDDRDHRSHTLTLSSRDAAGNTAHASVTVSCFSTMRLRQLWPSRRPRTHQPSRDRCLTWRRPRDTGAASPAWQFTCGRVGRSDPEDLVRSLYGC